MNHRSSSRRSRRRVRQRHPRASNAPSGPAVVLPPVLRSWPSRPPPQLPCHALERVFAFAVGEPGTYPMHQEIDDRRRPMIDTLACVCRDWSALANEIRARHKLSEFRLESIKPTRKKVLSVRRELTLRRAYLKSLDVYLHDDALCDQSKAANAKAKWQALGWDALLSLVPRLESLAIEACVVAEFSMPEIIAAAAAHCNSLQKLMVPMSYRDVSSSGDARAQSFVAEIPRILNATIHGLEAWHFKGTHGGVRELSLRLRTTSGAVPQPLLRSLIETIVRCCPQLEALHEWISWATESDEHWFIDASLWDAFCSRLSQLKQFSWHCVPFTTQFFAIFGTYPKPRLTKLTLAANAKWSWTEYHETVGAQQQHVNETQGFGTTAKNAAAVLSACPALKKLTVEIPRKEDASEVMRDYPHHRNLMDQEIFGDDFCVALAKHCPWIEMLEIGETLMPPPRDTEPILTFTDRGLSAVASLPYLFYLQVKATNITGQGLFSLLEHGQYGTSATRVIDLVVGDTTGAAEMAFYKLLESFLQCLTQHSGPLTFLDRRVALRVMNGKATAVRATWSKSYLARIKALVNKFKRRSRGARLNIITTHVDPQFSQFGRLIDFQLHTKRSVSTLKSRNWQLCPYDDPIDKVFVVRHDPDGRDRFLDGAEDDDEWYDYDSDELYDDDDDRYYDGDGPFGGYYFDELPWEDQLGYDEDGVPYAAYGEIYGDLYGDDDYDFY